MHDTRRPLRVLMLINLFMPEVFAGGEQQCLRLSRALRAQGVEPTILTSRSDPETAAYDTMDGIPVHRIWSPVEPQKGGRHLSASISWMRNVLRWVDANREKIDVIHCHHAKLNAWIGLRAARRIDVPFVVKLGSAGPNFDFSSLEKKRFFYGRLAAREVRDGADAFIATSAEMVRNLQDYGIDPPRLFHIPNGVDSAAPYDAGRATRLRADLRVPEDERLLVFAGRMERQKNLDTLLKAFAGVLAKGTKARLVFLGDGALLDDHQRLAQSLRIHDRVAFMGRIEAVGPYLEAADLFVQPARAEGMSNALLEAMAHGVPQVASKVSGNSDLVINGRTGWLYAPPDDPRALARSLQQALACPAQQLFEMGAASRRRIEAAYSIEGVADRHITLYRRLIDRQMGYADVA